MKAIGKNFGSVAALKNVSLNIYPNEIVGLVGENGAGKSTLMKVLLGIHKMDKGEILIRGRKTKIKGPLDANSKGIFMVFQEQSLLPNMTVYENLFLGYENLFKKNGLVNKTFMITVAQKELEEVGLDIDPNLQVSKLTFAQRQMVEIARNLWKAHVTGVNNAILIMDEPTSALGEKDIDLLFDQMRKLKTKASFVFISHKLNEIVNMCDRTYVLKDGCNVATLSKNEATEEVLRSKMVDGVIEGEYYLIDQQRKPGEKVVLEVRNLTKKGKFEDVSFKVHEGEIFCISGTTGSGKETICDILYGLESFDSGDIVFEGKSIRLRNPNEATRLGIGLSPADRKGKGLVMGMSVMDNITLPLMKGIIYPKKTVEVACDIIKRLKIKTTSEKTLVRQLSGGNQQKVIMSRLMLTNLKLAIISHPTRGVDVGAKREIYALIREMASKGLSIILMGDSFEEEIGLANNILTLKDGKCTGILNVDTYKPTLNEFIKYIV